jgi:8-oxo-dGTP diphosphatase
MKKMVAGFMIDLEGSVLLVKKLKPYWQAGKLNGIGGKLEPGETPMDAMHREWEEETGDKETRDWQRFCTFTVGPLLNPPVAVIHFYRTLGTFSAPDVNDAGEPLVWIKLDQAIRLGNNEIIPNLKWLLPLAFADPERPFADVRTH